MRRTDRDWRQRWSPAAWTRESARLCPRTDQARPPAAGTDRHSYMYFRRMELAPIRRPSVRQAAMHQAKSMLGAETAAWLTSRESWRQGRGLLPAARSEALRPAVVGRAAFRRATVRPAAIDSIYPCRHPSPSRSQAAVSTCDRKKDRSRGTGSARNRPTRCKPPLAQNIASSRR